MAEIIALPTRPRATTGAAGQAALVASFAHARRGPDDVLWLKENAELLNVLESTGQGRADLLTPYEAAFADLPARFRFFPQYYRFLLSIALDLEDMGLPGDVAGPMAAQVARAGLAQAELSDLQRAEARRLLDRRGLGHAVRDPGLDDRLRAFIARSQTFALPNRKAAYELTHILFYLSEYGRCDPGVGPETIRSLHFAGLVALLEHNADLLAEICIALRFARVTPPPAWEAWLSARRQTVRMGTGAQAMLPDSYHEWLMAEWMRGLGGAALFAGRYGPGRISFHMPPPDGPLRDISRVLIGLGGARKGDWSRMRPHITVALDPTAMATLALAERSHQFEAFFSHFARA